MKDRNTAREARGEYTGRQTSRAIDIHECDPSSANEHRKPKAAPETPPGKGGHFDQRLLSRLVVADRKIQSLEVPLLKRRAKGTRSGNATMQSYSP